MAKRFITKHLIENDRTTDILSEQLRTNLIVGEGEIEVVNLSDIEISSDNPRKLPWSESVFQDYKANPESVPDNHKEKWSELVSLSESIAQNGLMQPIVLRKRRSENDEIVYEIIAGERRYWASRLIDRVVIRAIIRKASDESHKILALTENLSREDLSLLEKVEGIKNLLSHNQKYRHHAEIQRVLGISRTQAFRLIKVLDNDNLYDLVKSGKITQISEIDLYDKQSLKPEKSKIIKKSDAVRWSISITERDMLLELAKQYAPDLYEKLTKK